MRNALGVLLLFVAVSSHSAVLTFDDVGTTVIPDGYGGLNWDNMNVINSDNGGGYTNGRVSGDYVAYNAFANMAVTSSSSELFDFTGAYLTGAHNNGLNIQIQGYQNSVLIYDTTIEVDTFSATWFQFDFVGIDHLEFNSFGGVDAGCCGTGEHFAMDNFTYSVVPIPAAVWLFGSGLGLLGWFRRKA